MPESAYASPPSLPSRLWALAQAIGWTGAVVAMAVVAIGANAILWAVQFEPESNSGYWLRRVSGTTPPLAQVRPGSLQKLEQLGAGDLREALATLPPRELAAVNRQWLRAYLESYREQESAVVLLRGDFVIARARRLTSHEFMPGAAAFLAQSLDSPEVFVELIAPAPRGGWDPKALQGLMERPLRLAAQGTAYAVVHAARAPGQPWLVTVVAAHPALVEGLAVDENARELAPPGRLRPENLPVLNLELADFLGPRETTAAGAAPPYRESALPVTFLPPGMTAELPPVQAPDLPKLSALLEAPAAPMPESDGEVDPAISPGPSAVSADAANQLAREMQREMTSWAIPAWPLYAPGQMPRGRLLSLPDAVRLRGYSLAGDPYYLAGEFEVSASGGNRAVLRLGEGVKQARFSARKEEPPLPVRFIVEFPPGIRPPARGRRFSRGFDAPLQVYRVENSLDGQINVYLREVIVPSASIDAGGGNVANR